MLEAEHARYVSHTTTVLTRLQAQVQQLMLTQPLSAAAPPEGALARPQLPAAFGATSAPLSDRLAPPQLQPPEHTAGFFMQEKASVARRQQQHQQQQQHRQGCSVGLDSAKEAGVSAAATAPALGDEARVVLPSYAAMRARSATAATTAAACPNSPARSFGQPAVGAPRAAAEAAAAAGARLGCGAGTLRSGDASARSSGVFRGPTQLPRAGAEEAVAGVVQPNAARVPAVMASTSAAAGQRAWQPSAPPAAAGQLPSPRDVEWAFARGPVRAAVSHVHTPADYIDSHRLPRPWAMHPAQAGKSMSFLLHAQHALGDGKDDG